MINRVVGYDTILMNSLLHSPGQGIKYLFGFPFYIMNFLRKFGVILICHRKNYQSLVLLLIVKCLTISPWFCSLVKL